MKKPRVFISSTIYDFKDLRSALKYFLEENNFEVVTSENVDFPNTNKNNSYQACLDAIETCDYFVLLIGARVGGTYKYKTDKKTEIITITRAEYRKAYELFKQEKIKIINFIRKEIYDVKEDRKGLEKVLLDFALQDGDRQNIAEHESKIIKDAGEVFRFVDEVSRNAEMRQANKSDDTPYPAGNWMYQFSSFRDIVTVLKNTLKLNVDLHKQIVYENIKNEIAKNLTYLTEKQNGRIQTIFSYAQVDKNKLIDSKQLLLTGEEIYKLYDFFMCYSALSENLSNRRMLQVLDSDVFFEYNKNEQKFEPNEIHKFITILVDKIDKAKLLYAGVQQQRNALIQYSEKFSITNWYSDKSLHNVDPLLFVFIINLTYVFDDIFELSKGFLHHYKNNDYIPTVTEKVKTTVFSKSAEGIENEKMTIGEIEKWLI